MSGEVPGAQPSIAQDLAAVRNVVLARFFGDASIVDQLLIAVLARGHVLLEGVPGIAKTTLVRTFAASLGCSVRRIQFTPDLLPADITGSHVLHPPSGTFDFRPGPLFAQLVLADEVNRAPAKTQSALLEAMQESQVTIEGETFSLPKPFLVLATQNPLDLEGTYPLPEAQLDRFLLRIGLGYPSRRDEVRMLATHGGEAPPTQPVLSPARLEQFQKLVPAVHVEEDLLDYVVGLAEYTRRHPKIRMGASPRASLGLVAAARARAVLSGREYVVPDDIQVLAPSVFVHRLSVVDEFAEDPSVPELVVRAALQEIRYRRSVRPL